MVSRPMLRQFQAVWQRPTTAAYAWFLSAEVGKIRLTVSPRSTHGALMKLRQHTQGPVNAPLWRPALARFGRWGFVVALASWGALIWALMARLLNDMRAHAVELGLMLTSHPQGVHGGPVQPSWRAPQPRGLTSWLGAPERRLQADLPTLAFGAAQTTLVGGPRVGHGALLLGGWGTCEGLTGRGDAWALQPLLALTGVRLEGAGAALRGDRSLGGVCSDHARVVRTLVSAWKRHLASQPSSPIGLAPASAAALYTRAAQPVASHGGPVGVALGRLEGRGRPGLAGRGAGSLAQSLTYVQAPLAWGA